MECFNRVWKLASCFFRPAPQGRPAKIIQPVTEEEFRRVAKAAGLSEERIDQLVRDHYFIPTAFEVAGKWYQIVGSHK